MLLDRPIPSHITGLYVFTLVNIVVLFRVTIVTADVRLVSQLPGLVLQLFIAMSQAITFYLTQLHVFYGHIFVTDRILILFSLVQSSFALILLIHCLEKHQTLENVEDRCACNKCFNNLPKQLHS